MKPFKISDRQYEAIEVMSGESRHVLLYGGGRSGKTFITLYMILARASKMKSRHLIIRRYFAHAKRAVWKDTLPKVISLVCPELTIEWNNSDYYLTFPNGSEIWIGGLDDAERADRVLGTEYSTILFNETSDIMHGSVETALSRLAEKSGLVNRAYYDENPPHKAHWTHRQFIEKLNPVDKTPLVNPELYASLLMNPIDNMDNISPEYLKLLEGLSTRKRERFLLGMWQNDDDRALWKYDDILRSVDKFDYDRIVVAIDPAVTARDNSDYTGIIVAGRLGNQFHVLDDLSGKYSPKEWASIAVRAYYTWQADRIVGEVNNGGDMIESTIRQVDHNASYREVRATRGKVLRAEPIAALYEQGRGFHHGAFHELEDQMTTPMDELENDDRIDAMVWAATELMLVEEAESVRVVVDYGEEISPY